MVEATRGQRYIFTYIAIASERSSESRHASDIQVMFNGCGEGGEYLRPDDSEVPHITVRKLGEPAVENVSGHVQTYACHDCLASLVTIVLSAQGRII